ncbi:MAG: protoheme IX farnesyltransferase [Gammaproteobacteria bacterium]|nr:protoheme IX farnesyltransferase [Gammaproteobacteria bacterium]
MAVSNVLSQPEPQAGGWREYLELTKPRVVAVMVLTSIVGMLLASPSLPSIQLFVLANLGIALAAGAAATVNHVVDRRIDTFMNRTKHRPVADGKVKPWLALTFAAILATLGLSILVVFANPLTAVLTFASVIGYALIYTLYLKRATPQNIVIGGIAGASPPLLGWVAVTGSVDPNALLLVAIIFAWTPPHFWALCLAKQAEYAEAGIPMLPVTHGRPYTKLHMVLYSLLMVVVTLLPVLSGMCGWIYLVWVTVLNCRFLWLMRVVWHSEEDADAMRLFFYSIRYIMWLFLALLVDHFFIL